MLVDTPADELLERLVAGKVYLPAQAERAAKNFFRKGNLMALRELALRRTADRVEDDVQAYRSDRSIAQVWKTEGALLCCIGPEEGAEHVVRSTAQLAGQLAVTWHAVYVETPALQRLDAARREGILRTVKLAGDLGARTAVLSAQGIAAALVAYARENNLSKLVLGASEPWRWWPRRTLDQAVGRIAPDIDRFEVGRTSRPRPAPAARSAEPESAARSADTARRYGLATAACAATTLLTHGLLPYFDLANIVMVFLLAVVGVGVWLGRGPAVLAAFLNVAAFDFFFVAPRLSFAVSDVQYLLTFAVMLIVGLVTGQLTAGLRFQARVAQHREGRSRALFEAARDLSNMLTHEHAVELAEEVIAREFRAEVAIYVLDAHDRLQPPREPATGLDLGTAPVVPGSPAARRPRHRHTRRQHLAVPAAARDDALARRARGAAAGAAFPARARTAPAARDLCRAHGDGAGAGSTTSRWPRGRPCRSSRSGCATRCWPRSRTTCARRWRRWSARPSCSPPASRRSPPRSRRSSPASARRRAAWPTW